MTPATPTAIDLVIGKRLRWRRRALDLSQRQLADALGVRFQQVQRYETGACRICASKLLIAAQRLQTPVAWFFEGLQS